MKIEKSPSFADTICDVRVRKIKSVFLNQIEVLIDGRLISNIINKYYTKGKNAVGNPSYDGLLLFKRSLLQAWYGLSDDEVEERTNNSISFSKFCGLTLEQTAPDHSTLRRFRSRMTEKNGCEKSSQKMLKRSVGTDASWIKKAGKLRYG